MLKIRLQYVQFSDLTVHLSICERECLFLDEKVFSICGGCHWCKMGFFLKISNTFSGSAMLNEQSVTCYWMKPKLSIWDNGRYFVQKNAQLGKTLTVYLEDYTSLSFATEESYRNIFIFIGINTFISHMTKWFICTVKQFF